MLKALIIFICAIVILLLLFIYSSCVLSSWCRKEEEKYERENKKNKMDINLNYLVKDILYLKTREK